MNQMCFDMDLYHNQGFEHYGPSIFNKEVHHKYGYVF
jgi:hypothetical protein